MPPYIVVFSNLRRYSINTWIKNFNSFIKTKPQQAFQRIFISHIKTEESKQWILKDGTNMTAIHPSMSYSVTLCGSLKSNPSEDLYIMSLLPINYWLVREDHQTVEFKNSSLKTQLESIMCENPNFGDVQLNCNLLAHVMSNLRPTGFIVDTVNKYVPMIVYGKIETISEQCFLNPFHKAFPRILISDAVGPDRQLSKSFCEIVQWNYMEQPIGRLLDQMPSDHNKMNIFQTLNLSQMKLPALRVKKATADAMYACNIKDKPFSDEVMKYVTKYDMDSISYDPVKSNRIDFTKHCVFTIDPVDAKDLDDALHIDRINDDLFEVGVHIADVSHFVKSYSAIDKEALKRSSSTYLQHKVIPMLPAILSEHLCSLNPNENKLAFSVLFRMNSEGQILSQKFTKSIIKSQIRLNYEQADALIDGRRVLELETSPYYDKMIECLKLLDELATKMRRRRIEEGALSIDKIEIKFSLEKTDLESSSNAVPTAFEKKQRGRSSFLIEEFMLIANQASANLLYHYLVNNKKSVNSIGAILRHHPAPTGEKLKDFTRRCQEAGIQLSDKTNDKVKEVKEAEFSEPWKALGRDYLMYFSMSMAMYCCSENSSKISKDLVVENNMNFPFYHYGLNVPLYTHFTSPIRRYTDILVHRQIEAIISSSKECGTNLNQRDNAVRRSNQSRCDNKLLRDELTRIYMAAYLNKHGSHSTKAIVLLKELDRIKVLLPSLGIIVNVNIHQLAPWSVGCLEASGSPKQIHLEYVEDDDAYDIDWSRGFLQYSCKRKDDFIAQMTDKKESKTFDTNEEKQDTIIKELDQKIDILRTWTADDEVSKIDDDKKLVFSINVFDEIYCFVFCAHDKLRVCIELPYPPTLSDCKSRSMLSI